MEDNNEKIIIEATDNGFILTDILEKSKMVFEASGENNDAVYRLLKYLIDGPLNFSCQNDVGEIIVDVVKLKGESDEELDGDL